MNISPYFYLKKKKHHYLFKIIILSTNQKFPSDYSTKAIVKNDNIIVPYTIIKQSKIAKEQNVKEIVLLASERPDRNTSIRSTLDLWGLSSYIDYIYTTSELAFLEGLTPILKADF